MKVPCRSPFVYAGISYNGQVYLCGKYPVGSLYERDFTAIWYGSKAERLRTLLQQTDAVCLACNYYKFCIQANRVDYDEDGSFSSLDIPYRTHGQFELFTWGGRYYAVPLACRGDIREDMASLLDERFRRRKGILSAESEADLLRRSRAPGANARAAAVNLVTAGRKWRKLVRWGSDRLCRRG
jgi:radical SAM protein with 4Fe4S-binding SPASM domain